MAALLVSVWVRQSIAPVGSPTLGVGLWGHVDLTGNLWEWTLDWYGAYGAPCTDCASLTPAADRVFRGGGFDDTAVELAASYRRSLDPTIGTYGIGFRCARTP